MAVQKRHGYRPPKDAVTNVLLVSPINVMGEDVTELHFREARFGDLRGLRIMSIDDMTGDQLILLTHRLAGIPERAAESISFRDLQGVAEAVGRALDPFSESEDSEETAT